MRRKAFTLVELLVVIAIITILAAMLLPTLEKSMDAARTQKCANQLKQIGTAFYLYESEYSGYFPGRGLSSFGYTGPVWWDIMPNYLGKGFASQYSAYGTSRRPGDENMAFCPVFDRPVLSPSCPRPDINRNQYWQVITYDINFYLSYRNSYPNSTIVSVPVRPDRIKHASECVLIAEAGANDSPYCWRTFTLASPNYSVYYNPRHGTKVANVRIDGSVRPEALSACSYKPSTFWTACLMGLDRHCWFSWNMDMAFPNVALPAN